jgi:beta-lactamase regulating signal transducer with metallopeptidase domain
MNPGDLHTFLIYVFFGYIFIFPLVLLCLKLFRVQSPKQRMGFYLLALVAPIAGFALYHTVLVKRCQAGTVNSGYFWQLFDYMCWIGGEALRLLGPVILFMAFAGLLKVFAAKIYIGKLQVKAANPATGEVSRVEEIIRQRCRELNLKAPEILFSDSNRFSSFVTGFMRPQVMVSLPLIKQMSDRELQAILTHELIHIRRGDTRKGWFLHLLKDIMFFSPFSLSLLDRYLLERERLCDREAVLVLGNARDYAAALLKAWRLVVESRNFPVSALVGFNGKKRDMEQRILSLLATKKQENVLPLSLYFALLVAVGTLTILFLGMIC